MAFHQGKAGGTQPLCTSPHHLILSVPLKFARNNRENNGNKSLLFSSPLKAVMGESQDLEAVVFQQLVCRSNCFSEQTDMEKA